MQNLGSSSTLDTAHRPANRPGLAIIANCLTPYRVHLHQQIAERLPEIQLHTIITHGSGDFSWRMEIPPEINVVDFSEPGDSANQHVGNSWHRIAGEFRKAGRLAEYFSRHNIAAAMGTINLYASHLLLVNRLRSQGVKFFVNADSNIHNERRMSKAKRWLKGKYYQWWLSRTDGIMSMGRCGDEFFAQYWPRADRVYCVPYWPDLNQFMRRNERANADFRAQHQLPAERRLFLYSGRLIAVKRVDLLIEAFATMLERRPEWDLVIAGEGPLRADLQKLAACRAPGRVHWTGFLEVDAMVSAYQTCQILVLPSDYEPWALVVCEALAAGLPVISSDVVGAAHELIQPNCNGELFQAGERADLAAKMLIVSDSDRYEHYRQAAKPAVLEWQHHTDPCAQIRRALVDTGVIDSPPARYS